MTEPPVANLMSVAEAIAILDAERVTPQIETVPLRIPRGRRLAADIVADRDYPPFDKALMDGFALESPAVAGDQRDVIDIVHAGQPADVPLSAGKVVAVMTGAPVPRGAVAVVPIEFTTKVGDRIRIDRSVAAGQAIARRGSDTLQGTTVLRAGTRIGAPQIAVAAAVGLDRLTAFRRPWVNVISTGDELVDIERIPVGAQIRDSNSVAIGALLRSLGCDVGGGSIIPDDREALRLAIDRQSTGVDALFVTGGMSMGEKDFVPGLLGELGFTLKIAKLRIKPGKPFAYATRGDRRIFGLPGNPVSAYVCTLRLAARLLRRLGGGPAGGDLVSLKLSAALPANGPREFYLPAVRSGSDVAPLNPNGSADIFTLATADVLIVRPEDAAAAAAGDIVDCLPLNAA